MATINLGAIKFNWKGAYNSSTSYAVDDVVSSGGNSYVCIQAHSTAQAVGNATAYWNIMSSAGTNGTNGTDVGTTLTTQGDILYRDGSGLQRLPKGTANQVLKMNSGATAPEYGDLSSDFVLLSTSTINASAVAVDNVFTNDYKFYQIKIEGLYGNTDGEVQFNWRYGGASGNSSTSSTYRHFYNRAETNGSQTSHDATLLGWNNNHGKLFQNMESGDSTKNYNATIDVYNPFKNSWTYWNCRALSFDNSGAWLINYSGGGVQADSTSITGIRINAGAGDFSSGTMKIYGLK